jgi:PAS domain S-box-containing protein
MSTKNNGISRSSTTETKSAPKKLWRLFTSNEPDSEIFRAQQLRTAMRLAPFTEINLTIAMVIFCVLFWNDASHALLLSWAAAILVTNVTWYAFWLWSERTANWESASRFDMRLAIWHVWIRAMLWTLMIAYLFGRTDSDHRILLASVAAGMIGAGAFYLSTLRQAVFGWVLVFTVGCAYALIVTNNRILWIVCFFLLIYAGIILATALHMWQTFIARHQAEADAAQQKQVVELLLRDFEAGASDWLWETDTAGNFRYVSQRMSELIGRPDSELLRANLNDFIVHREQPDEANSAVQALRRRLTLDTPFRDCIVPLSCHDRTRWVALSAKPLFDSSGSPHGWRGVGTDITVRKLAEEELRHSYAQVRALVSELESAREQERERLARELHDEFGQILAALRIDTSWIRNKAQIAVPEIARRAEAMADVIEDAQQATKRMSSGLRPRVLDDLGLVTAIRELVNEFADRHGIVCEIQISDDGKKIVDPVATPLYRMTQEALTNIAKHSQATKLRVELVTGRDSVILIVADNGKGLQVGDLRKPGSFGLMGMRQRAAAVGGELSISEEGGNGTTIEIRLPLID